MWSSATKQAKQIASKKKGMGSLEFVISILIFFLLFAAFVDIATIGVKFSASTQAIQHVTRTVGVQGGLLNSAPTGYPGGPAAYNTGSRVDSQVRKMMKEAGVPAGDYSITVNGGPVASGVQHNYMDDINIDMNVDYKWEMLSRMLPGEFEFNIQSSRSTVSEFKYRDDTW